MKLRFFLLLLVLFLFFSGSVFADFSIGNKSYSIEKKYSASDSLNGWINISLNNEPSDSLLTLDSSEISLAEFLDLNFADYSCFPKDCKQAYEFSNGADSKTISIESGKSKLIGFKLQGDVTGITSLRFDIDSSAGKSCISPLSLDVLNDDEVNWEFETPSDQFTCKIEKGCYENSLGQERRIDNKKHCEKLNLELKPKYEIGAWIKKNSTATSPLKAYLYDSDMYEIESCNLPDASASGGEISCVIEPDLLVPGDYYVCITGSSGYTIKYETSGEKCGFYNEYDGYAIDYYIFAKSVKYEEIDKFTLDDSIFEPLNDETLENYIWNYIDSRYEGNCSNGCAIPVKLTAGPSQDITIDNVILSYTTNIGSETSNLVYDLSEESILISSDFIILDLDEAGLKVPSEYGEQTIILYLGDEEVFEEDITIAKTSNIKAVLPLSVAAAVPTIFYADVDEVDNKSIVKYEWDFAGSNVETTTKNSIEHTYSDIGSYTLRLTVEDEDGNRVSKEFTITANSPKQVANETIKDYRERIESVRNSIDNLPSWYRNLAESLSDLDNLDSELKSIEKEFSLASESEEYINVMGDLVALKVPKELKIKSGNIPKLIYESDIDVDALSQLGAGSYQEGEDYEEAVANWFNTYVDAILNYKIISLKYDDKEQGIVSVFSIKMTVQESLDEAYFIADFNLSFSKEDYDERELDGKTGIILNDVEAGQERRIEFATDYISPEDSVFYLSPKLSRLEAKAVSPCNFNKECEADLGEDYSNCRSDCKPWGWVLFFFGIILFLALVIYVIMQQWYRVNYEKSLFKNKNDLFNIVNFINHALSAGLDRSEVKTELKRAGWSSEQISYGFKKAEGKIKVIKELPFLKFLKKKKPVNIIPRPGETFYRTDRFRRLS